MGVDGSSLHADSLPTGLARYEGWRPRCAAESEFPDNELDRLTACRIGWQQHKQQHGCYCYAGPP